MGKQCEIKTKLLAEYMATLEKFKVAEREHKEILLAGTGQGVVQRSAKRIEAIKRNSPPQPGRIIATTAKRTGVRWQSLPAATSRRATVPTIPHRLVSKRLRLLHRPLANHKKSRWVFPITLESNRHSTLRGVFQDRTLNPIHVRT